MLQKVGRAQAKSMLGKVGSLVPSGHLCPGASSVPNQGASLNRAPCPVC